MYTPCGNSDICSFCILLLHFIASALLLTVACLVFCFVIFTFNIILELYLWKYLILDLKFVSRGKICVSYAMYLRALTICGHSNILFELFSPHLWVWIPASYPIVGSNSYYFCLWSKFFFFPGSIIVIIKIIRLHAVKNKPPDFSSLRKWRFIFLMPSLM